jgi:hypothetical protein
MAKAKREGWQKGLGKFADAVKVNQVPGDDPEAKGKNVSKEVYGNNDNPAYRGTREGFS